MKKNSNKGYTLVELLVVIGILSVIGALAVSVIFITLRGSKKSDTIETLRQTGDTALSQVVKNIRFAKSLDTPSSCVPSTMAASIAVTSLSDNGQTTFSCVANTIASNGASLVDTNAAVVSACSFTCTQAATNEPPTIMIQFTLSAKSSGNFVDSNATLPFQSSVTMRNFSP